MKYVFCILASLFLISCQDEFASDDPTSQANQMIALVAASPTYGSVPQQCPRAVYQSRQSVGGTAANCGQDPAACLAQCEAGNSTACFDAARTIEKGKISADSHRTFPLFMAACELGMPNACVNAAATVKNGDWPGARPAATATATAQCQFQTYDRMCKDGAAWGCYMVGLEYQRSDGFRPASDSRARASFARACDIAPASGACVSTSAN